MENIAALAPAMNGYAVTPSDTADLPTPTRGIILGTAGNVEVDFVGSGSAIVLRGLLAGYVYPIQCKRIRASNTTATGIVALS